MSYFLLDETKEKTIEEGREAYNYTWGWHRTGKSIDILVLTHTQKSTRFIIHDQTKWKYTETSWEIVIFSESTLKCLSSSSFTQSTIFFL